MYSIQSASRAAQSSSVESPAHGTVCDCSADLPPRPAPTAAGCLRCGAMADLVRAMESGELPFLVADAMTTQLAATSKEEALDEIVTHLVAAGVLDRHSAKEVVDALIHREAMNSTGIGGGVAIPHTKHPQVDRVVGTLAWSQAGLEFDSIDDQPVHLLVVLLAPLDQNREHVQALAKVARLMRPSITSR